ncbi:molybdopterin cofactor-binding domain-containing protein [Flavicella sp.]|uniref:xanthine dehydrogenase family protein molybdopterin-binding subunit n=1 Tax=Flavicella sp. TaxID=2957742 RepID=UPI002632BCA7|nr:molybdopterin cofactor-binding domain-containing protein [Flavicella sp.]MDG1805576.1 molybdopterin-dependent oxidoreductase [Flavicella sp.]
METTKKNSVDRRLFMKTSLLASGGILFGFNLLEALNPKALVPTTVEDLNFHEFNAYIKIAENGKVTLFSPNPEIGQGVKTSMPMIVAEELDVAWEDVTVVQAKLDTENFKRQVAGGSQSIRKGWKPLRQTGATARQMLLEAAALKWKVSSVSLSTKEGFVFHENGSKLGYGELVEAASKLEIPSNVTLKNPEEFSIIGQGKRNVDVYKITKGESLFGLDYKVEGMLYAAVLRPPAFGQKLKSFDATQAKKLSGVVNVFQFEDNIAVIANNTWAAFSAKKLIVAEWSSDASIDGTLELNSKMETIIENDKLKSLKKKGDVKVALNSSDKVLEASYDSSFLPHNCMEPMNFYANVTPEKIELAGSIQTPQNSVNSVAKKLGRDISEIDLKLTRIGGGFGRRLTGDFVVDAAVISDIAKKPIKLVYTREDDMTGGIYKPAVKYKFKAALKKNDLIGYELKEAAVNRGMGRHHAQNFPFGAVPNLNIASGLVQSEITIGWWRAPVSNFLAFAEQSFLDEVAISLKKDPIEYRLEMLANVKGKVNYSASRMIAVIEKVRKDSKWGSSVEGTFKGFSAYYSHQSYVAEVVEIEMKDGLPVIKKVYCAVDCGVVVNPMGADNQVVGGIIDGVGHAMYGDFEFENGKPTSSNYDKYRLIRMNETPQVFCTFVKSDEDPTGLGEPTLPPVSGAIGNAIAAATGKRIRKLPFVKNWELNV